MAVTVQYSSSNAVSSLLYGSPRRCFCVYVYVCVRFCLYQVCVSECVLSHNQYTAAAQQQQCNGSRVSSSRLCVSSHGACVSGWCAAGDRSTTTLSRPIQQSHTHRRTLHQVFEAYCNSKSSSSFISLERFLLFDLRRPGDIKSTPSRRGTLYYI